MSKLIFLVTFSILFYNILASKVSTGDFNKDFEIKWSPSHVNTSMNGLTRTMSLDKESGSAMSSKYKYLFGQFDMKIKLIPGNSAGTVVAFYLYSYQLNHDEIDFEFLGNVAGKPIMLQTNVFVGGVGNREHKINLWFDPTKDFHTYSIQWSIHQIVFMVDWIPIRVFRNYINRGATYPMSQPLQLLISVWNGETWATDDGKTKIDWSKAPFVATFGNYTIDACVWKDNERFCETASTTNWWNKEEFGIPTRTQRRWLKWVKNFHLVYDYCRDNRRFNNNIPVECSLPIY